MDDFLKALADALQARGSGNNSIGTGSGVKRDPRLDDAATPADERAGLLEAYTGALLERPQASWSVSEKKAMREQIDKVLGGLGY